MKIIYWVIIIIIFFGPIVFLASTSSASFNVGLDVYDCNNNGICEIENGETSSTCNADCAVVVTSTPTTTIVNSGDGGGGGFVAPSVPIVEDVSIQKDIFNVINLSAVAGDAKVLLSWEVVSLADYAGVLIRRSEIFPPSTISEGGVLYNGKGELLPDGSYKLADLNLKNGRWYFYTIFLYDKNGKYASGASIAALPQSKEMNEGYNNLIIPPKKFPPELSIIKKPIPTVSIFPTSTNIKLVQDLDVIESNQQVDNSFTLNSNVSTTIVIEKREVPEGTTAVVATLNHENKFQTFFLKKESSGDYVLNLPASLLTNSSSLIFTFIDKNLQVLDSVSGSVKTKSLKEKSENPSSSLSDIKPINITKFLSQTSIKFVLVLSFVGFFLRLFWWWKRRKK